MTGERIHPLLNATLFQIGWFACVLGVAQEYPYVGPPVAALVVAIHLFLAPDAGGDAFLIAKSALLGVIGETLNAATGVFSYATGHVGPLPAPWLAALWFLFPTTLRHALSWLQGRYVLAAALGAWGGAASYFAGAKLGAISLEPNVLASVAVIGVQWAVITPLLVRWSEAACPIETAEARS